MTPFDQDELEISAKAYALSLADKAFSPTAAYLPATERLRERGWLDRRMIEHRGEPTAVYELTSAARAAMALAGAFGLQEGQQN